MYNNTRKITPLREKKRVTSNSNKPKQSVNSRRKKTRPTNVSLLASLDSKRKKIPAWLKSLKLLENSSFLMALCLIFTTLGIYSWTVLTQQTWSQQYRKLENLQRQERDFTLTSETIKNQLATKTDAKETELIPATPEQTIFLKSADSTDFKLDNQDNQANQTNNLKPVKLPLGY